MPRRLLLLALILCASTAAAEEGVTVAVLSASNRGELLPEGKEVDAIDGDFVLRNEFLTAVIGEPIATRKANMTVGGVGGALIDLTANESNSDQLSAFYAGGKQYRYRMATAGENAVTVTAPGPPGRPEVKTTWSLTPQSQWLTVRTVYANTHDEPISFALEDHVRADGGKEDMRKSPNGTSDVFWIHDRFWGQAYGVTSDGIQIQSNSNSRDSTLRYLRGGGDGVITLGVDESVELTRRIFPDASLMHVRGNLAAAAGEPVEKVTLVVKDAAGRPIPGAMVDLAAESLPWGGARTGPDGRVSLRMPRGMYQGTVTDMGVPVSRAPWTLKIAGPVITSVTWEAWHPGLVRGDVRDGSGQPIPAKIQFLPQDGTPLPNFGPETANEAVRNVHYAAGGPFEQRLPAGRYDVIVSRGPEYDAVFTELVVAEGGTADLNVQLKQSVKTPGWISTDFHSHSSPSGDNTGSQVGRVLNLACEHIEFAPCTEHNRIDTYDDHISQLGLRGFLASVPGMELTGSPLPLNHQNVFPLEWKPFTQDGGGPVTDSDPEKQIERIALWDDRSEKLVQQNHPDIGWLFYDRNGDQKADQGYQRAFSLMDVMEIHPIDVILDLKPLLMQGEKPTGNNRVFNWLQLLNQGFRVFGVVNTDAHYNFHGSGGLRNWVRSPTDEPGRVDHMDVVHAAERGQLVMSNGPFLEATVQAADGGPMVGPGEDVTVTSGDVKVHVRVQCANWLDVDRVFLLVNGRLRPDLVFTRESHPDWFRDGVTKFDRTVSVSLKDDAHLIVVTGHGVRPLGPVMGPSWGRQKPTALSNPVFVNVDGDDFIPNADTLDHPLPVKFK